MIMTISRDDYNAYNDSDTEDDESSEYSGM